MLVEVLSFTRHISDLLFVNAGVDEK